MDIFNEIKVGRKFNLRPHFNLETESLRKAISQFSESLPLVNSLKVLHQFLFISGIDGVYLFLAAICGSVGTGFTQTQKSIIQGEGLKLLNNLEPS